MQLACPRLLRRVLFIALSLLLSLMLLTALLPNDHVARSLVRFLWNRLTNYMSKPIHEQTWFFKHPKHPINFDQDVGLIIKTGYGTQHRILPQMEAMGLRGTDENVIVVGDFEARLEGNGIVVNVADVVGMVANDAELSDMAIQPRVLKYQELTGAVQSGNDPNAAELGDYGWQLDAIKFIPGLYLAYKQAPSKKWWIIMDDDTFLLKASLEKILARLDPLQDHYIGNPIGDYKARFAHGGSAIVVSQRAVAHLFEHPDVVLTAKRESLTDVYGDKLVATTLRKLGIYLDERFEAFFTGYQPKYVRMFAEDFCLPIASFHGLGDQDAMLDTGRAFRPYEYKMVFWGALWTIFQQPDISMFAENPVRAGHDHVGNRHDLTTTFNAVDSALDCVAKCDKDTKCLAWTWVEQSRKCTIAPFVVLGDTAEGRSSGIHFPRAKEIGDRCTETMRKAGCFTPGSDCGL